MKVILHDDDVIEWDDQHPPLCDEERHRYALFSILCSKPSYLNFNQNSSLYTLVSSTLARFARYIENREVAKQVLKGYRVIKGFIVRSKK